MTQQCQFYSNLMFKVLEHLATGRCLVIKDPQALFAHALSHVLCFIHSTHSADTNTYGIASLPCIFGVTASQFCLGLCLYKRDELYKSTLRWCLQDFIGDFLELHFRCFQSKNDKTTLLPSFMLY